MGATGFVGDVVTGMLRRFHKRHSGRNDRRAGVRWFVSVYCLYRERLLAEEIARTGRQLDLHRQKEFRAPPSSARSAVEVKARFPAGPPPDR